MGSIVTTGNKIQLLRVLEEKAIKKNRIIPFPEVSKCFSWYRIGKEERDALLYEFQKEGLLRIVPYHGIILTTEKA